MKGRRAHRGHGAAILAGAAAAVLTSACGGPSAEHVTLTGDLDELRANFVADSGKVRALFLASPT